MGSYNISYEIFDYDLFYQELYEILHNAKNKFCVTHHLPLGKSGCGFSIEHYTIGYGPLHIVYMAGAHGNEIIGVAFTLQLMRNLALGKGVFKNFNPSLFTIDFIPLQNPEGYFTTTYALKTVMGKMNSKEKEIFCKKYYLKYREENEKIKKVNTILEKVSSFQGNRLKSLVNSFWHFFHNQWFDSKEVVCFLEQNFQLSMIEEKVNLLWKESLGNQKINPTEMKYLEPFQNLDLNCIPLRDEAHIRLRKKLEDMYKEHSFPMYALANFLANASGINLNANNPYYFNILKNQKKKNPKIYASPIYPILKSDRSPYGTCSFDSSTFSYALENAAILQFLEKLEHACYAFFNIHGTGGLLYAEPYYSKENDKKERDFSFYINNRIATRYLQEIEATYLEKTGKKDAYVGVGYPEEIRGFGDMLRNRHIGHFLLELSRAGGNPIGPYIEPNYTLTMEANFRGCDAVMSTILELQELYDKHYIMHYNQEGKVSYETRKLQRKTNCSNK